MSATTFMNPDSDAPAITPGLDFTPSTNWPEWFQETQRAAWDEFLATPAPLRKDVLWRYANVGSLALDDFRLAPEVQSEGRLINQSQIFTDVAARFVFGNNRLLHSETPALPAGVLVKPLAQAATENEALFRDYFMSQPVELGSHKYAALHRAFVEGGMLIHVPANIEVALPIEIFHWVEGEGASVFPHTLILCGENSKVTVIDAFKSADGKRALACGVNDLHLAPGAKLHYIALQDWSRESLAFHINSTLVDRDASSTALTLNFGGKFVRGESLSRMIGRGAGSIMLSLNPVEGEREIDQRTLQIHTSPGATSNLLYHNALDDKARTIFSGLIKVEPGAHETDAYQKVRNLLLSDDAEADSMPGLEILADNVKCSHGATSGEISDEELFYMQARGITPHFGRRLIVAGFFHALLEHIEDKIVRARLGELVDERLGVAMSEA